MVECVYPFLFFSFVVWVGGRYLVMLSVFGFIVIPD